MFPPRSQMKNPFIPQPVKVQAEDIPEIAKAPVEAGIMLNQAPYFTGSVSEAISMLWDKCEPPADSPPVIEIDSVLLWSTLSATAAPPASTVNRHKPTEYVLLVDRDMPPDGVDDKATVHVSQHKRQERTGEKFETRTVTSTERKSRRTFALTARTAEFGKKIMNDYKRILGLLESGAINRKWVVAVSRWILRQKDIANAKGRWVAAMKKDTSIDPGNITRIAAHTMEALWLWAKQEEEIVAFEPSSDAKEVPTEDTTLLDTPLSDGASLGTTFVKTLSYSRVAVTLQARAVCPFCVYAELAGIQEYEATAEKPQSRAWTMPDNMFTEFTRVMSPRINNKSWVEACARAHNREMHSANGNIDSVTNFASREPLMAAERAYVWDAPTIGAYEGPEQGVLINKAIDQQPKVYYTDRTLRGTQAPTNVGTLYQYLCPRDVLEGALRARIGALGGPPLNDNEGAGLEDGGGQRGTRSGSPRASSSPVAGPSGVAAVQKAVSQGLAGPNAQAELIVNLSNQSDSSESTVTVVTKEIQSLQQQVSDGMRYRRVEQRKNVVSEAFTCVTKRVVGLLKSKKIQRASGARVEVAGHDDSGCGDGGGVPPDDDQEDARQIEAALQVERMRWVAVGCDPARNHGKLVGSAILSETIDAATDPVANKPGMINGSKASLTYGFMSNTTSIAAAVSAEVMRGRVDWRVLGVKVTLYDELRERRMVQPSGVDWAWASTHAPGRMEYPLCYRNDWHYDAIFITTDVLEAALRRSGGIPVGHRANGVSWHVNDPTVLVIVLGDNGDPTSVGRDMWVLSHLTYPLLWVFETFRMYTVGREGPAEEMEDLQYTEEVFSRLAGQVDINLRKNKIIYSADKDQEHSHHGGRDV